MGTLSLIPVASSAQTTAQRSENAEDKERFRQRGPGAFAPLALVRGTWHLPTAILAQREAASQGKGRPRAQPLTQIGRREPPKSSQEGDQQS